HVGRRQKIVGQHLADLVLGGAKEGTRRLSQREGAVGYDSGLHVAVREAIEIGRLILGERCLGVSSRQLQPFADGQTTGNGTHAKQRLTTRKSISCHESSSVIVVSSVFPRTRRKRWSAIAAGLGRFDRGCAPKIDPPSVFRCAIVCA